MSFDNRFKGLKIFRNILLFSVFLFMVKTTDAQKVISDFRLKNVDNKWISLKKYPSAKGFIIVFICNHCPFANRYISRLNVWNKKYVQQGIPLIAVNSSDTTIFRDESFFKMIEAAKNKKISFPYLYDNFQSVAANFGANRTPHAFIIWKEKDKWIIKYNGSLDDNGAEPSKITHSYIDEAINSLLAGKNVTSPVTNSIGCEIHYRNSSLFNYRSE